MIERTPPEKLQQAFEVLRAKPSDINEHLDLLREYASRCNHVTEFGMRFAVSTTALLAAQPDTLVSWDIDPWAIASPNVQALLTVAGRTKFQPRVGDTHQIQIEETDMLFIDSLHTFDHLKRELELHAGRVRRYIAFHDTMFFGKKGEDGSEPGLRAAIYWLQMASGYKWTKDAEHDNNNGFFVLRRM